MSQNKQSGTARSYGFTGTGHVHAGAMMRKPGK
jgi:hypothetical protein